MPIGQPNYPEAYTLGSCLLVHHCAGSLLVRLECISSDEEQGGASVYDSSGCIQNRC